jgi:hypothetical protein
LPREVAGAEVRATKDLRPGLVDADAKDLGPGLVEADASDWPAAVKRLLARARAMLPKGGELPVEEWQRRHRALVAFLWINVVAVVAYSLVSGQFGAVHNIGHVAALVPFALLANSSRLSRKAQAVVVSLGLMTAAALFVHLSNGLLETHFYFFVLVVLLTIYEEWLIFFVAVVYVLLHHGVMGMFDPHGVFDRPEEWADPWKWATIHAVYIALAGVARSHAPRAGRAGRDLRDGQPHRSR